VLLDLSNCFYGKEFIDGLQRILSRTKGRTTVLISGAGRELSTLGAQTIDLSVKSPEVLT